MNQVIFKSFVFLSFALLTFSSCKKDEAVALLPGDVSVYMDNVVGASNAPLAFATNYVTANGDTVQFSEFNYFVSNFVMIKADGSEYVVPQDSCYFLCKHSDKASRTLVLKNIPAGDYNSVRFIIGVDSSKSVSNASQRTGVLDPAAGASGMYWAWNSGYIFVKVEGTSPQAPLDPGTGEHTIEYHTGLYGGLSSPTINNIKTVTLSSSTQAAKIAEGNDPEFHVFVNILEMFTNPTTIDIATNPTSHAGAFSKTIADNYADMFKLDHIHN